jgi:DNA-binding Lrp family transcriptional regulator/ferredoxin
VYHPDELDAGILRELQNPASRWNVRGSMARIAKRLRVDEETVRRRVSKMEEFGVVQGWTVTPNPHLLGRERVGLYIEPPETARRDELIENLGAVDGVVSIHSFHRNSLLIFADCPRDTPVESWAASIEDLCGSKSAIILSSKYPPFEMEMTSTDWAILGALRRGPRRKLGVLAKEMGVSVKTLNRRMQRLIEAFAFHLEIQLDFQRVAGMAFTLVVRYGNTAWKEHADGMILEKLGGSYEWSDTRSNPEYSVFSAFSDNVSEAEQTYQWVRTLKGVADVRMEIQDGRFVMGSWIDKEIQSRVVSAPTAKELVAMERRELVPPPTISAPSFEKAGDSWWTGSLVEGRNVRVQIDADLCMGSASCVAVAPRVFRLDWAKKRSSVSEPAPLEVLKTRGTEPEALFLAAQSCPYGVIRIEDADTGEQLYP